MVGGSGAHGCPSLPLTARRSPGQCTRCYFEGHRLRCRPPPAPLAAARPRRTSSLAGRRAGMALLQPLHGAALARTPVRANSELMW